MFNKLRLFLKGKSTQVEKKIVKNEAYWDGKLKDCSDKMNKCNERYSEVVAKIKARSETLEQIKADMEKYRLAGKKAKEKFDETGEKKFEILVREAFTEYTKLEAQVQVIEVEIEQMSKLEEKLALIRNNTQTILSKMEIDIARNKARIKFSDTMKDLTSGIEDLGINMKMEGSEEVAEDFFKYEQQLDDLSTGIELENIAKDASMDKKMEAFLSEDK
jgi:phage shock protein A